LENNLNQMSSDRIRILALALLLVGVCLLIWACSSQSTDELKAAAISSIERVDSLSKVSFVGANVEMQRFTALIHDLQRRDKKTDWVKTVLAEANTSPNVINPLRFNVDPAREYAILAKAETNLYHLTALWNLIRVPLWEADRANKYLLETMLSAGAPDLAMQILAIIPPNEQRAAAIAATTSWFTRHATDSIAVPSAEALSLLVELTLEIHPVPTRTIAILNAASLLEELGYEDKAEKLEKSGELVISGENNESFVASAPPSNIGNTTPPERTTATGADTNLSRRWTETTTASELLRSCQTDSERVAVLIELAEENFKGGKRDLALQQLDVAQMFLQLLDDDRYGDYVKEQLLEMARLYTTENNLESALHILTDHRLSTSDTWVSFTLADMAVATANRRTELSEQERTAVHEFIRDEILDYGG